MKKWQIFTDMLIMTINEIVLKHIDRDKEREKKLLK